jgi:hypothetical protein
MTDDELRHEYPNVWAVEKTTGPDRLVIAPASGHVHLLKALFSVLQGPFWILYVLLVSRKDNLPGRYQCPGPVSREECESFLVQYREYFEGDGRHHIWVGAEYGAGLLIYDHHNVIYAYGPLEEFKVVLRASGLTQTDHVRFPVPHTHHYHSHFDEQEERILKHWEWRRSELQSGDDR